MATDGRAWRPALVWGLVGGLSFLVLLQGYELASPIAVDPAIKFGTALLVMIGATVTTAFVGPWLRAKANETG